MLLDREEEAEEVYLYYTLNGGSWAGEMQREAGSALLELMPGMHSYGLLATLRLMSIKSSEAG